MQPVADYQSQYIAIIALMRSVGHVFDKVDCNDTDRRNWSNTHWPTWKKKPIFKDFIEPTRNALLKEFRGGLQLKSDAFGSPAIVFNPSMPGGVSEYAAFNAREACDFMDRPVLPNMRAAIDFWNGWLDLAETAFGEPASPH